MRPTDERIFVHSTNPQVESAFADATDLRRLLDVLFGDNAAPIRLAREYQDVLAHLHGSVVAHLHAHPAVVARLASRKATVRLSSAHWSRL
ncbi:hypothetical protein NGM37_37430, partial [Streptomyces sp. TRM76130]|nr:hypothetical protein [Streptomyces sp. TRM76130]